MDTKIMVVDDAMFMRKIIRRTLEEMGYSDVVEACDGEQAIQMFMEERPDLVLLDITMPGKSGLEVLDEILRTDIKANIVMCSAVGQEMMIQKAVMAGAVDFIVKPFKTEEFQRIVKHSLMSAEK